MMLTVSNTKLKRARILSKIGQFPGSFDAVIATIGPEVIAHLPSPALARLVDRVWDSWQESKAIRDREILDEVPCLSLHKLQQLLIGRRPETQQ